MVKENMSKAQKLTFSAMIMALYIVVLYFTQSFSFGAYQIRIATSLYGLSYLFPFLVLPLGFANFIANMLFGGLGLLDRYDPAAEGFTGVYSDVLRKTNHTVLGCKGGLLYGVYCKSMTAQQVNAFCRDKLKLTRAVMLDGGHVAAINGACNKINKQTRQFYAVRFL